jgi:outer membrane protein OmpA-like peptidoglycan-associated protein
MGMNKASFLVLLLGAAMTLTASGQSSKPSVHVMKGSEVNEAALIDALVPPPPITRNLSVGSPNRSPARRKSAQASLLIEFETNSTELTSEAKQQLDIVGRALNTDKLMEFNFMLEGHADPRGTAEWNQRLSEGRADAVRQYLVDNQNVNSDRLKTIGKGDREPINLKNPAAPENRRVTILNLSN